MNVIDIFNALAHQRRTDMHDEAWRADMSRRGMEVDDDGILMRKRKHFRTPERILDQEYARESDLRRGRKIKSLKKKFAEAVSPDKAIEIFDTLSRMRSLKHDRITGGCEARTHLMCAEIFDMGIIAQKSWAVGDLSPGEAGVEWKFHVAPALDVKMPDGSFTKIVLDPSLFDGPVLAETWRQKIGATATNSAITAYDESPNLKVKKPMGDYADQQQGVNVYSDRRARQMIENAEDWSVSVKKRAISRFREQFAA